MKKTHNPLALLQWNITHLIHQTEAIDIDIGSKLIIIVTLKWNTVQVISNKKEAYK